MVDIEDFLFRIIIAEFWERQIMKRIAEDKILSWSKSPRRKPLIIRGARQVGKTWLVENCLAKQFDNVVKINLESQPHFHEAFSGELTPETMLNAIEARTHRIIPGKTLLFIDEIQGCPRAITALRYFYEQLPELHVVAAGSMLEFAFGQISVPVGRIQYLHLQPMTFYEFLLAMGKEILAEKLLEHPEKHTDAVVSAIHEQLKNYFFIGGMPEAVAAYRDTHSMLESYEVHSEIVTSYREDFTKYRPAVDYTCLDTIFQTISQSVGQQIVYTHLYEHATGKTNHKAFDLLCKAKLVNRISSTDPSGLPLGAGGAKRFKASLLDIGLMQHLCGIDPSLAVGKENLLSIYNGRLAEQFVAQEFLAWHGERLYYWSRAARSANAEVDFLAVRDNKIYPVEVKSGPAGRLKSLHLYLEKYPDCEQGWILQDGPYRELPEQKLVFWPLYA
ncbi:MAG: ATP-binding protein, partial [Planctomycetota bacterium]